MSLLPTNTSLDIDVNLATVSQPLKTYRVENGRIVGTVDGIEAIKQAVDKILATERFQHLIYSWNYGVEFFELVGKEMEYVVADAKRRFEEALLINEYILGLRNFNARVINNDTLHVEFMLITDYGDIEISKEVGYGN